MKICWDKLENLIMTQFNYDKKNCHPDNLIALCHICNGKANGNREFHKKFYMRLKENE